MYWFNGAVSESPLVQFDLSDRGLLLGDGVFDTSLVLKSHVVFGDAHLERLYASLAEFGIKADLVEIAKVQSLACAAAQPSQPSVLRITVTRGAGPRGLLPPSPHYPMIFASLAATRAELFFAPLSLEVSGIHRNETSPAARHKTLSYLDAILANRQAVSRGFDGALFLNGRGSIACAATGNIFAVFGKKIVTPKLSDGCLAGIIRATVLELAAELGFEIAEATLDLEELLQADRVFLTNSLRLIAPVTQIGTVKFQPAHSQYLKILQDRLWHKIERDCNLVVEAGDKS
jgi:branched-chain amino acid aminotransferase